VGHCTYQYNASEIYQRTKPGQGVETVCGGLTFPAIDEPEIVPVRMPNPGVAEAVYSYHATGRMLPRAQADPFCPRHGGSPEPPPPPVTMAELQAAHAAYLELAARFEHGQDGTPAVEGVVLPALTPPSAAAPVTAEQLQAASTKLAELAEQAAAAPPGGVSDEQPE
jgi:hypothetical protein